MGRDPRHAFLLGAPSARFSTGGSQGAPPAASRVRGGRTANVLGGWPANETRLVGQPGLIVSKDGGPHSEKAVNSPSPSDSVTSIVIAAARPLEGL